MAAVTFFPRSSSAQVDRGCAQGRRGPVRYCPVQGFFPHQPFKYPFFFHCAFSVVEAILLWVNVCLFFWFFFLEPFAALATTSEASNVSGFLQPEFRRTLFGPMRAEPIALILTGQLPHSSLQRRYYALSLFLAVPALLFPSPLKYFFFYFGVNFFYLLDRT